MENEKKILKSPKTFAEQVEILRRKNIIIEDENEAIRILKNVNYYRLSAYMLTHKYDVNLYYRVSITDVYELYKFDKEFRYILFSMLESIEIAFRTHISYHIAHKYGALGYQNNRYFRNQEYHRLMLKKISDNIKKSDEIFISHHIEKYNGLFPIWVIVEISSFGELSKIYNNMLDEDKYEIAKGYYNSKGEFVSNWLHALSNLRNRCAHYGRLYNKRLTAPLRLYVKENKKGIESNTIFGAIYVIGRLSNDKSSWESFVTKIVDLLERYPEVEISQIGFPIMWEQILRDI